MSAPSTSGLSVELLLRVIDVKYGCFTFTLLYLQLTGFSTYYIYYLLLSHVMNFSSGGIFIHVYMKIVPWHATPVG